MMNKYLFLTLFWFTTLLSTTHTTAGKTNFTNYNLHSMWLYRVGYQHFLESCGTSIYELVL